MSKAKSTKNLMEVKMWKDTISLPTYETGQANKNPLFLEKRVYQGSSGKIYPLAFTDTIYNEKVMKDYEVIYIENQYLKIMIMPCMGGKIYRALDKTNNYDFVYYNEVVKPALVGLAGPWVSGGIEFNWPQHHRPSTFSPVEYRLVDNEDGSKTCWISEIDRMYGTKGMAGFTLHQDKAYIEIKGQLYNRTDLPQTFLWWANPAVAVNDYTKSIFPPDVYAVYDHGKRDVSSFPIARGTYYKMDYSAGVDISMYKNIPVPTSYMAYHSDYNFVGGYDYSVEAGILHIANHHISPGKKQWTWGNGDFGQAWDRNLTDENGPYIELMTGIYTDNQPDFTWLSPKEGKTFTQYFMPYKGVGEVKNACLEGLINLQVLEKEIKISYYSPSPQVHISLSLYDNETVIYQEQIKEISPEKAYTKLIELHEIKTEENYRLVVLDANNTEIIAYQPKIKEVPAMPEPAKAPKMPKEIESCEDLYLIGQHIEQYRHATYLPEDYYLEALKRNPQDIRNNNAYGLLMYRRGRFELAEKHFRKAITSLTRRNPNPYDSEPFYNLGLVLKKQGKLEQAYKAFYKSTWNGAWQNCGYHEVASIDCLKGDYVNGLEHITMAIVRNWHDTKSRGLKIAILRKLGKTKQAHELIQETLAIDVTAFASYYENYIISKDLNRKAEFIELMGGKTQNYIELALDYGMSGFYQDAIEVLQINIDLNSEATTYPMVYYLLGYFTNLLGKVSIASSYYEKGATANSDYCFPHRLEELIVLEEVIKANKKDSKALYYLGNLYYDKKQYDLAMNLWEKSIALDGSFSTASRNLALAYVNKKEDPVKGLYYLEKAFNNKREDARVFFELDQLYKRLKYDFKTRLQIMEEYSELVNSRDDLYVEYLAVLNNLGFYEKVIHKIESRQFHPWEGGEGKVTAQYKRCRLELAKAYISKENYLEAEKLLHECYVYPQYLGEGKLLNTAENEINYLLGLVSDMRGLKKEAAAYYYKASKGIEEPTDAMFYNDQPADMIFYQGLAHRKLGNEKAAKSEFDKLITYGENNKENQVKIDYFAVSLPDFLVFDEDLNIKNEIHCKYLMALGLFGNHEIEKAKEYIKECFDLNPNHQGVYFHRDIHMLIEESKN